MDLQGARAVKQQLATYILELVEGRVTASAGVPTGIAVGVAPRGAGEYEVALRYQLGTSTARMIARRAAGEVGPALDVRRTGRIRPLRSADRGGPVARGRAVGETGRVRPLRPGVSVAHHAVTAGTLGGFVTRIGEEGVFALSNHHVFVGGGQVGDAVLQPGPADGGRAPADRVGELAHLVPLRPGETAFVDAALARLDDPQVAPVYPVGTLAGWAPVDGAEHVQKLGRTTGLTDGRVTAIEMDDVVVGYGSDLGELRFDNQIEVEATDAGPFSRGGDSGSLVYRPVDHRAVGLLFAGSETGGENGGGLTYLNPIDEVLTALGATLV